MNDKNIRFELKITPDGVEFRRCDDTTGTTNMWTLITSPTYTARTFIKRLKKLDLDWVQINSFWVHENLRGQGLGNIMMNEVIRRMNGLDTNIILRVRPYNNSPFDIERLTKFYAWHGFVSIKDYGVRDKRAPRWMVRYVAP